MLLLWHFSGSVVELANLVALWELLSRLIQFFFYHHVTQLILSMPLVMKGEERRGKFVFFLFFFFTVLLTNGCFYIKKMKGCFVMKMYVYKKVFGVDPCMIWEVIFTKLKPLGVK